MPDAGLSAVENAIFGALNHASVTALVPTTRHLNTVVPLNDPLDRPTEYPLVLVSFLASDTDRVRSFAGDAETLDYLIRAYDFNTYELETVTEIAEAIDARLVGQTLSPTGYVGVYGITRVRRVRGFDPHLIELGGDRKEFIPHPFAGAVYRFWTQRS